MARCGPLASRSPANTRRVRDCSEIVAYWEGYTGLVNPQSAAGHRHRAAEGQGWKRVPHADFGWLDRCYIVIATGPYQHPVVCRRLRPEVHASDNKQPSSFHTVLSRSSARVHPAPPDRGRANACRRSVRRAPQAHAAAISWTRSDLVAC